MSHEQPRRKIRPHQGQPVPASVIIPDKLYFRIGDVAQLCNLEAYVLRYWETEFPQLKPNKGGTGQRLYRKRDVEMVLEIKRLLYGEGFTIAGARRMLAERRRPEKNQAAVPARLDDAEISQPHGMTHSAVARSMDERAGAPSPIERETSMPAPAKAGLSELRQEMRELLKLLASDSVEHPAPLRNRRDPKKNISMAEEPTLFQLD